jgi:hypothetical protein
MLAWLAVAARAHPSQQSASAGIEATATKHWNARAASWVILSERADASDVIWQIHLLHTCKNANTVTLFVS